MILPSENITYISKKKLSATSIMRILLSEERKKKLCTTSTTIILPSEESKKKLSDTSTTMILLSENVICNNASVT